MSMLSKGTVVKGVWHKNTYRVYHELGRGAIGVVYVVENVNNSRLYAMKVASSMQAIAAEYKRLETIQGKVQSKHFGPLLFEMDDIQLQNGRLHYYTMEYIEGRNLGDVRDTVSKQQYISYIRQIVSNLHEVHLKKMIFSDVKPENILVETGNDQVRFVDFGGVVPIGRMVKQYSVLYDRGSWKMGSRKADIQFDLFAVGILILQWFTKKDELHKAQKNSLPMCALYDIIHKELHPRLKQICIRIFSEKYDSAEQMNQELEQLETDPTWIHETSASATNPTTTDRLKSKLRWKKSSNWMPRVNAIDSVFWVSFVFMIGSIYYVVNETLK